MNLPKFRKTGMLEAIILCQSLDVGQLQWLTLLPSSNLKLAKQVISRILLFHNLKGFHSSLRSLSSTSSGSTITMFTNVPSPADLAIIFPYKDGGLAPFHRERPSPAMDMAYRVLHVL